MQAQDVPADPPADYSLINTSDRIGVRLERLPLTSYQHGIFVIVATAWLFDSIDLASLTFVLGSIREEFGLSTQGAGLLASISFIGMFLGASIAGIAADRFGRKAVFQIRSVHRFHTKASLYPLRRTVALVLPWSRFLLSVNFAPVFYGGNSAT